MAGKAAAEIIPFALDELLIAFGLQGAQQQLDYTQMSAEETGINHGLMGILIRHQQLSNQESQRQWAAIHADPLLPVPVWRPEGMTPEEIKKQRDARQEIKRRGEDLEDDEEVKETRSQREAREEQLRNRPEQVITKNPRRGSPLLKGSSKQISQLFGRLFKSASNPIRGIPQVDDILGYQDIPLQDMDVSAQLSDPEAEEITRMALDAFVGQLSTNSVAALDLFLASMRLADATNNMEGSSLAEPSSSLRDMLDQWDGSRDTGARNQNTNTGMGMIGQINGLGFTDDEQVMIAKTLDELHGWIDSTFEGTDNLLNQDGLNIRAQLHGMVNETIRDTLVRSSNIPQTRESGDDYTGRGDIMNSGDVAAIQQYYTNLSDRLGLTEMQIDPNNEEQVAQKQQVERNITLQQRTIGDIFTELEHQGGGIRSPQRTQSSEFVEEQKVTDLSPIQRQQPMGDTQFEQRLDDIFNNTLMREIDPDKPRPASRALLLQQFYQSSARANSVQDVLAPQFMRLLTEHLAQNGVNIDNFVMLSNSGIPKGVFTAMSKLYEGTNDYEKIMLQLYLQSIKNTYNQHKRGGSNKIKFIDSPEYLQDYLEDVLYGVMSLDSDRPQLLGVKKQRSAAEKRQRREIELQAQLHNVTDQQRQDIFRDLIDNQSDQVEKINANSRQYRQALRLINFVRDASANVPDADIAAMGISRRQFNQWRNIVQPVDIQGGNLVELDTIDLTSLGDMDSMTTPQLEAAYRRRQSTIDAHTIALTQLYDRFRRQVGRGAATIVIGGSTLTITKILYDQLVAIGENPPPPGQIDIPPEQVPGKDEPVAEEEKKKTETKTNQDINIQQEQMLIELEDDPPRGIDPHNILAQTVVKKQPKPQSTRRSLATNKPQKLPDTEQRRIGKSNVFLKPLP